MREAKLTEIVTPDCYYGRAGAYNLLYRDAADAIPMLMPQPIFTHPKDWLACEIVRFQTFHDKRPT